MSDVTDNVQRLPLHDIHERLGARFAPFAGYEMPMRYDSIVAEHHAVRGQAGLFDVSHMGQVFVTGAGSLEVLNGIVTNDLRRLGDGQALYTVMCNEQGGILDDIIVYRLGSERWLVCVNAATRHKDVAWLRERIGSAANVDDASDGWCQFAVQGPAARQLVADVFADAELMALPRFACVELERNGVRCIVARTGYTGEDGFELYVPASGGRELFEELLDRGSAVGLRPIGLAARDTLRLEAGYLLYGADIDEQTNPLEAGIGWVVNWDKGPFIGREALVAIRASGPTRRSRLFQLEGRGVLRAGYEIRHEGRAVGALTSGGVAPSLDGVSIGRGYVEASVASAESVAVVIREREHTMLVKTRAFVQNV